MDFRQVAPDIQYWLQGLAESGSMRQNLDLLTTLEHTNDSTCCFFARKGRCVLGVPEFATYFRFESSEVRGKTEFCQPDPGYTLSRPAVLTLKFGLRSAGSDFPALPEMGVMAVLYTARKAPRKGQSSGSR